MSGQRFGPSFIDRVEDRRFQAPRREANSIPNTLLSSAPLDPIDVFTLLTLII
jgi:hypothetical protein